MTCLQCGHRIMTNAWRYCSRACYYESRRGKPGPRRPVLPENHWHAEHMRVMAWLQAQRTMNNYDELRQAAQTALGDAS